MTDATFDRVREIMETTNRRYGLRVVREQRSPGLVEIVLCNETTCLRIMVDRREGRPLIGLCRVRGGQPPEGRPIFVDLDRPLDEIDFDSLVALRGGTLDGPHKWVATEEAITGLLGEYVPLLDQYASDVLNGDFTVFEQMRPALKAHGPRS
jgi:hypothetical protein